MMHVSPVKIWLGLLLAIVAAYGGYSLWKWIPKLLERQESTAAKLPDLPIEPFTLTDRSGEAFDSASLRGQVWVASFFFSTCPGACVKMNNSVADLQKEFGPRGATFVSITVDPETDTPQRLADYAAHYRADARQWRFLTGDMEVIKGIASDQFHLPFAKAAHSERLLLVGPDGRVQGRFAGSDPTEIALLKRKLEAMLQQLEVTTTEAGNDEESQVGDAAEADADPESGASP